MLKHVALHYARKEKSSTTAEALAPDAADLSIHQSGWSWLWAPNDATSSASAGSGTGTTTVARDDKSRAPPKTPRERRQRRTVTRVRFDTSRVRQKPRRDRVNRLIVGGAGAARASFIQALLQRPQAQRILELSPLLQVPSAWAFMAPKAASMPTPGEAMEDPSS